MPNPAFKDYLLRDASTALPNGAASTTSDVFDLGLNASRGQTPGGFEIVISAPALGATPLPNAKTMIYSVECDDDPAFGSPTVLIPSVITQLGAGGVGDAAKVARVRLPNGCERYVRVKATGSGSGDASGSTFSVEFVF